MVSCTRGGGLMIVIALIAISCFVYFSMGYYSDLKKIRSYLKSNNNELYKKYSLDLTSIMLGTEDVEWNAQKFILEKKFVGHPDKKLVDMCNQAYESALFTIVSFLALFVTLIINGALSS